MTSSDLPEPLLRLIERAIPTYPAAELLLFLTREPQTRTVAETVQAIQPAILSVSAAEEYLHLFKAVGLVVEDAPGSFRYAPASRDLERGVEFLRVAYNERPVTLIRTISRFADQKLQMFADAFKIKPPR